MIRWDGHFDYMTIKRKKILTHSKHGLRSSKILHDYKA